jgi:hypothetical protein
MKIKVKNLGPLKQAEFTLGDLTIICGGNNTGKTYATYALFGFLYTWERILLIEVDTDKIEQLLTHGVISIDIKEYVAQAEQIIVKGCRAYTQQLPKIFAASAERFQDTEFELSLNMQDISLSSKFERTMRSGSAEVFSITKSENSTELIITLLVDKNEITIPRDILKLIIANSLKDIIFDQLFPRPFIASAERTGAAIFRKELNFVRDRLWEEIGQSNRNIDPMEFFFYEDYALPIKTNVEFTRQLETTAKKKSVLAENHQDVLDDFADIIGGEYTVTSTDELYYIPKNKQIKLSMDESSSAVRSLLDIGFYLRHEAKLGDLLMVDEPELTLHPENQRRIARLFARLVNLGIRVFMTTHSDYIVKEMNTLIMLKQDKSHLKQIAQVEGYLEQELISSEQVKVYIAEEALVKLDGNHERTKCQTLTLANISPELGIEARSFDITIAKMNQIQEAIVWGEE